MIHPIVFGKFILLERVSVGGMAEVYRAKLLNAPEFERFFAIKRILPHLAADKEFVSMFINEAKVAVELEHPNICQIYELGRLGQSHYIAMEFIAGRDVLAIQSHYRREKKIMSVSQACFIIAQAAQGLDYAHRAVDSSGNPLGLIHRDISPQNLIVTFDGVVKLIDFGISKASRRASHSKSGVVKGKFSYMSPEQAADREIDHRSDIFALGILFWELLTGRRLFQSESEYAIIEMIEECKIDKPSKYNKMVPDSIDRICMKALEHDPDKRYQWASEMVLDLFEFINSCKTPFTQWHLQTWMCSAFQKDLEREWELLPIFKDINTTADIDKYNRDNEDKIRAEQGYVPLSEAKTADAAALSEEIIKRLEQEEAEEIARKAEKPEAKSTGSHAGKLPPIPGRGIHGPSETSKSMPNVKSVSLSIKSDAADSGARLSICTPLPNDDDVEFEPEGVSPSVSDPQLLHMQRIERKARMRRGLVIIIVAICLCFIVSPALLLSGVVKVPKPAADLPQSANVTFTVVPESKDASVTLTPKDNSQPPLTLTGSKPRFDAIRAGVYTIDVTMPDYKPESFSITLENGNIESRLEMTDALPKPTQYQIDVTPDDAKLYVDGKLMPGSGQTRTIDAIIGKTYSLRVVRLGYEQQTLTGTVTENMPKQTVVLEEGNPVRVKLSSAPAGGIVFTTIDGKRANRGMTPMTLDNLDITKPIEIEIHKAPHAPWKYTLDFEKMTDSDIRLFADFEK